MFLRRNRQTVKGECYEYWTLVKTVRTAQGPRQEIVAILGKEPGLESRTRHDWEAVAGLLEGRTPAVQGQLGANLSAAPQAQWAQVDLRGVRVERVREFGQIYLALSRWRRLGLHTLLQEILAAGQEDVPWELACWPIRAGLSFWMKSVRPTRCSKPKFWHTWTITESD